MSGVSIIAFAAGGIGLAAGLGGLLALDPAEAAARNDRIRNLTEERRNRRAALEKAAACAVDERERVAQRVITARVAAAGALAALAAAGLPADPQLVAPAGAATAPASAAWARVVPAVIVAAHERAGTATAELAVARLRTLLAGQERPPVRAADLFGPDLPDGTPPASDAAAVLPRMLATLHTLAAAADRERVAAAAADVVERPDTAARLAQLRLCIQEANDRVERRHDDAVTAAQLLDAMSPYQPSHGLDPTLLGGARAGLADVVAGRRELDDGLLDLVADLRRTVEARASAATVTDAVADVLDELGYRVGADFSVGEAAAGMLEISHPERPDHLVRMRVDAEQRRLVAMVYRSGPDGDAEADSAVEAAWCGDLDKAIGELANSGLILTPELLTAPGSKPTPTIAAGGTEQREATQHRHHTNRPGER